MRRKTGRRAPDRNGRLRWKRQLREDAPRFPPSRPGHPGGGSATASSPHIAAGPGQPKSEDDRVVHPAGSAICDFSEKTQKPRLVVGSGATASSTASASAPKERVDVVAREGPCRVGVWRVEFAEEPGAWQLGQRRQNLSSGGAPGGYIEIVARQQTRSAASSSRRARRESSRSTLVETLRFDSCLDRQRRRTVRRVSAAEKIIQPTLSGRWAMPRRKSGPPTRARSIPARRRTREKKNKTASATASVAASRRLRTSVEFPAAMGPGRGSAIPGEVASETGTPSRGLSGWGASRLLPREAFRLHRGRRPWWLP